MQRDRTEPYVDMRIDDAGNHSIAMQVNDTRRRAATRRRLRVGSERIDARARHGQRFSPRRIRKPRYRLCPWSKHQIVADAPAADASATKSASR